MGVKPSITGLVLGPKSKAYSPSKRHPAGRVVALAGGGCRYNSGAGGLSPMAKTSFVMPPRLSGRPGRDFSPTYSCFSGRISVLWPGGTTVV